MSDVPVSVVAVVLVVLVTVVPVMVVAVLVMAVVLVADPVVAVVEDSVVVSVDVMFSAQISHVVSHRCLWIPNGPNCVAHRPSSLMSGHDSKQSGYM